MVIPYTAQTKNHWFLKIGTSGSYFSEPNEKEKEKEKEKENETEKERENVFFFSEKKHTSPFGGAPAQGPSGGYVSPAKGLTR